MRVLSVLLLLSPLAAAVPLFTNVTVDPWKAGGGNIIGGHEIDPPFKYPFLVALVRKGYDPLNGQFCGASLVSSTHVLTAAHCCDAIAASQMDVLLHWHDLKDATQGDRIAVKSLKMHPDYNPRTIDNDICVLQLEQSSKYKAVELDTGSHSKSGTTATVAGWGNTNSAGSDYPSKAMEVQVPVVTNQVCNSKEAYDGEITGSMLCAGFGQGGKDACQGDSGGPLFVGNAQIGVVSWGYGCAQPNKYGVYARVSEFTKWIESAMAELN